MEDEVDWGVDESIEVDEWRQGAGTSGAVDVGATAGDEDVISLNGLAEDGDDAIKQDEPQESAEASPKRNTGKEIPTGPKAPMPPTGPRSSPQVNTNRQDREGVPTGPRGNSSRDSANNTNLAKNGRTESSTSIPVSDQQQQAHSKEQDSTKKDAGTPSSSSTANGSADLGPLPEGWTVTHSRTHNKPFYHHKASGKTSWIRPTVEQPAAEATSAAGSSSEAAPQEEKTAKANGSTTAEVKDNKAADNVIAISSDTRGDRRPTPTGPSRRDDQARSGATANAPSSSRDAPPTGPGRRLFLGVTGEGIPTGPRPRRDPSYSDRDTRPYPSRDYRASDRDLRRPRSPSPRREDPKRFKRDDSRYDPPSRSGFDSRPPPRDGPARRSSPPPSARAPFDNRRSARSPPPASFPPVNRRSPPPRDVRDYRQPAPRRSPPSDVRSRQRSPIRQQSSQSANGPPDTISRDAPTENIQKAAVNDRASSTAPVPDDAAAKRAKLAQQRKEAEEAIKRLADEEAKLEKEEEDRKRADAEKAEKAKDDERKKREADEARMKGVPPRPPSTGFDNRPNSRPPTRPPPDAYPRDYRARSPPSAYSSRDRPLDDRPFPRGPPRSPPGRYRRDPSPGPARPLRRSPPPYGPPPVVRPDIRDPYPRNGRSPPPRARSPPPRGPPGGLRDRGLAERMSRDDPLPPPPRDMRDSRSAGPPPPLSSRLSHDADRGYRDRGPPPPGRYDRDPLPDGRRPPLSERMSRPPPDSRVLGAEPMSDYAKRANQPGPPSPPRGNYRSDSRPLADRMGPIPRDAARERERGDRFAPRDSRDDRSDMRASRM